MHAYRRLSGSLVLREVTFSNLKSKDAAVVGREEKQMVQRQAAASCTQVTEFLLHNVRRRPRSQGLSRVAARAGADHGSVLGGTQ